MRTQTVHIPVSGNAVNTTACGKKPWELATQEQYKTTRTSERGKTEHSNSIIPQRWTPKILNLLKIKITG